MSRISIYASIVALLSLNYLPVRADTAPGLVGTRAMCPAIEEQYLEYEEKYKTTVVRNMAKASAPEGCTILFRIDRDGFAKNIFLFDSSKSRNFDCAAIESFLTSLPFQKPPKGKTLEYYEYLLPARVDFKPVKTGKKNESLTNIRVHAIPLGVLSRYPGQFTAGELDAPSNSLLYAGKLPAAPYKILPGTSHDHSPENVIGMELLQFFNAWTDFFSQHKTANRYELLKHRDFLLEKFKSLKKVGV